MKGTAKNVLRNLDTIDHMVIMACIHHCAVMPKAERERFIKDYGQKTDRALTRLLGELLQK